MSNFAVNPRTTQPRKRDTPTARRRGGGGGGGGGGRGDLAEVKISLSAI